jgi:hypothetical protein
MSQIYPKQIDYGQGFAFVLFTNGIPFVNFGYTVYENVNYDTATYDSAYVNASYVALSEFSYTYIVDNNDANKIIQVTVDCGNYTYIFSVGEYVTGPNNQLDLGLIITQIETALNF